MTCLCFEGVSKRYGGRLILRDVSFRIASGEILLLVGANGAGKSTLLRLAAGLSSPTNGTVARGSENIGYLGHATGIYPGLTALENLAFWQRLRHEAAGETALMPFLERVGLTRRAHDRAGSFSRGMAQRLNLARLLAQRPDLLLLDEPGTGLDADATRLLAEEILAARARGAGVMWVSHDVERDVASADRVIRLDARRDARGKRKSGSHIVFDGPAADFAAAGAQAVADDAGGGTC